ncbi:MAG TPA: endopeptidase La [Armatimonadota bacterium]|nr:endopeptidase La [Armatimonadota bacterium]HPO73790.1 endopeptidase La [Armatimonadota bacterium]HPT98268.1 endopeptidase La [Armatimonadota bacterium]
MPRKKKVVLEEESIPSMGNEPRIPELLPVIPLRDNQVVFPRNMLPLFVGREKSIRALEQGRQVLLVAQRDVSIEEPETTDLYTVGTVAEVMQIFRLPEGAVRIVIEGLARARVRSYVQEEPFLVAQVQLLEETREEGIELQALMRSVCRQYEEIVNLDRNVPPELLQGIRHIDDPGELADQITPNLPVKTDVKQDLLETLSSRRRLEKLTAVLSRETEILHIENEIRSRVDREISESQREFYLRERLKAIQQELGERDERLSEIEEFREKIAEAEMPPEVSERALKEVDRLEKMPFATPEAVVVRNYLDWLVTLPWARRTEDRLDITEAEAVLDEDHYGLKRVKERCLEFLAVCKLTGQMKGPILCFVGPPGVGKTSIGKSIARALGRKFIRVSLGGIRDEAEIRGHRRTYIGSMPGRVIQAIRQAGTRNPVFMLDEVDKVGADFRGDPTAALLEALDPEQNTAFSDHYLEVPFDLSDVMFITTANLLDPIHPALKDRMEVIHFPGYTEAEKLEIARRFLVPKQREAHGLSSDHLVITDEALVRLIREYTREAGVRNLEREIAAICRKIARRIASGNTDPIRVTADDVPGYLGPRQYRYGMAEEHDEVAVALGLSYTEFGGDVLPIEVILMRGKGNLMLTGQLGDVMKESAQAAHSWLRARAQQLGIDEEVFGRTDIHVHVPAGAVPKDGPSAGITIATALASAFTGRAVRKEIAMTGEITLRGRVLPVGGVKEKVLAAHRAGVKRIVLPEENDKDLEEIPDNVRGDLEFLFVKSVDEVLAAALVPSAAAGHA